MPTLPLPGAVVLQGVTFACINHASLPEEAAAPAPGAPAAAAAPAPAAEPRLATFALRITQSPEALDQFVAAVNAHKAGGAKKGEAAAADP